MLSGGTTVSYVRPPWPPKNSSSSRTLGLRRPSQVTRQWYLDCSPLAGRKPASSFSTSRWGLTTVHRRSTTTCSLSCLPSMCGRCAKRSTRPPIGVQTQGATSMTTYTTLGAHGQVGPASMDRGPHGRRSSARCGEPGPVSSTWTECSLGTRDRPRCRSWIHLLQRSPSLLRSPRERLPWVVSG